MVVSRGAQAGNSIYLGKRVSHVRILHILNDGPRDDAGQIMAAHMKQHEVAVIDLSAGSISYAELVDKIEHHDQVICW